MSIILHSDGLLGKIAGTVYGEQVNLIWITIRLIDWVGLDVSRVFRSELQNDVATAAPNGTVILVPARKILAEQIDLLMQMLKELPKDHGQDRVH